MFRRSVFRWSARRTVLAVAFACTATACAFLAATALRRYSALDAIHRSGFVTVTASPAADSNFRFILINRLWWHNNIERSGWLTGPHYVLITGPRPRQIDLRAIEAMAQMQNTVHLDVTDCGITAQELASLANIWELEGLSMPGNPITDEDLDCLTAFPRLRWLRIDGTNVTRSGLLRFRNAMPKCAVVFDNRHWHPVGPSQDDGSDQGESLSPGH